MLNQMCPNHRTYASLPTTLIATSEATRVSIMLDQEYHKKNSRSTNSRALTILRNTTPKREGLVPKYQIKSTTKKRINNVNSRALYLNQMCPNHHTYASLPTTLIATSEVRRSL